MSALVRRTEVRLLPDARRVLARPFAPGEEVLVAGASRAALLMARVLAIPEGDVAPLLSDVLSRFAARHRHFESILERNFERVAHHAGEGALSRERRLLAGAYFTHEYSVEGAALFNPSMVPAPEQDGLRPGELRFVMSLRAVGEGHLSSIEFRSGVVTESGQVAVDAPGTMLVAGHRAPPPPRDRTAFAAKLQELGASNDLSRGVLARLPDPFTPAELEASLASLETFGPPHAISYETVKMMRVLAASSYLSTFPEDSALSERVIFPAGPIETRGMEDARFVRFRDDDGSSVYYATYTAYDGFQIFPQLIETADFVRFRISGLSGAAAQDKGMALFPRRIGGDLVMLSRRDRESLHLARSRDVRFWGDAEPLIKPTRPWQLLHLGNCGSPVETEAGWVVFTHGVGPMRTYALGAILLDLEDPSRVIGRLEDPLLAPEASEREGYVPNVLYSCGGLRHGDLLFLPFGFSDAGAGVAVVSIAELLARMA